MYASPMGYQPTLYIVNGIRMCGYIRRIHIETSYMYMYMYIIIIGDYVTMIDY